MTKHFKTPKILKSEIVFHESIVKIQRDLLQKSTTENYTYYSLVTPKHAVFVLALTADNLLVTVAEYRHPTRQTLLSLPGGFVEEDENAIDGARRELLEETGYQAETFTIIGSAYPYAGFSGQKTIFVLATNAQLIQKPQLETSEIIQVQLIELEAIYQVIAECQEIDATICTGLFFLQQFLRHKDKNN